MAAREWTAVRSVEGVSVRTPDTTLALVKTIDYAHLGSCGRRRTGLPDETDWNRAEKLNEGAGRTE